MVGDWRVTVWGPIQRFLIAQVDGSECLELESDGKHDYFSKKSL